MKKIFNRLSLLLVISIPVQHFYAQETDSLNYPIKFITAPKNIPNLSVQRNSIHTPGLHYFKNIYTHIPPISEGKFCNFEDYINRNGKLRIDFGTD